MWDCLESMMEKRWIMDCKYTMIYKKHGDVYYTFVFQRHSNSETTPESILCNLLSSDTTRNSSAGLRLEDQHSALACIIISFNMGSDWTHAEYSLLSKHRQNLETRGQLSWHAYLRRQDLPPFECPSHFWGWGKSSSLFWLRTLD